MDTVFALTITMEGLDSIGSPLEYLLPFPNAGCQAVPAQGLPGVSKEQKSQEVLWRSLESRLFIQYLGWPRADETFSG